MRGMNLTLSFIVVSLIFTILVQSGSCRNKGEAVNTAPAEKNNKLANGVWGGQHIYMEVTDNEVSIVYDCAHGAITQPIILDGAGTFDVKGTYIREHGGPIRKDEELTSQPARYAGQVKGDVLTLTLTLTDTEETVATFTLTHGSEGQVRKCR